LFWIIVDIYLGQLMQIPCGPTPAGGGCVGIPISGWIFYIGLNIVFLIIAVIGYRYLKKK